MCSVAAVGGPQVPEQPLFGDALGNPPHDAFLHPAEERLRLFDDAFMPGALGFLQLLVEFLPQPDEEPCARLFRLIVVRRLVVALKGVARDRNEVNVQGLL